MATDPIKPKLNRANQLKTDKQFNKGITLYDIDLTINNYMEDVILPTLNVMDQPIKVPVLYGSPERWKSIQKDGYLRDKDGVVQLPLVVYKRTSVDRDEMQSMMNRHVSYPAISKYSAKHRYDLFSQMIGAHRPLEQYNVTIPDYVTLTYDVIIWTDFIEQMNTIVEAFQYASDDYWGDKDGFKFRTKIDSFNGTVEVAEGDQRLVKTDFSITVNAYLLPEKYNNEPTTNKSLSIKKVIWDVDI